MRYVPIFVVFAFTLFPMPPLWAQETSAALPLKPAKLEIPIRLVADGVLIDSAQYRSHSGPTLFDLNGDGLRDLIVGNYGGHFQTYLNIGSKTKPVFKSAGLLKDDKAIVKLNNW